jgi:hypothetical protein
MFPRKLIATIALAPVMFAASATEVNAGGGYGWGAFAAGTLTGIAVGAGIARPPVYAYPPPVLVPGPPVVAYAPLPWVRYGPPVAVYGPPVVVAPPPRIIYGPPPPVVVYGSYPRW